MPASSCVISTQRLEIDSLLALILRIEHELRTAMTLCGATSLAALRQAPLLQSASFRHQVAELRRADWAFSVCQRPTRNTTTEATASRKRANDDNDDVAYQTRILPGVSRTFALTIPQLPEQLRHVVCNTYLLCRIADTVEDEPELSAPQKQEFLARLVRVVTGHEAAAPFARELYPLLSSATLPSEQDLVANTARIVRVTHQFHRVQRNAIERCVSIMTHGMAEFQQIATLDGLADQAHLDRYCYFVAGIVGETLTELFCHYSDEINQRREDLFRLSVAFGQGLQMTNILKDVCNDRLVRACWLPRDIFRATGFDLGVLAKRTPGPQVRRGDARACRGRLSASGGCAAVYPSHSSPRGRHPSVLSLGAGHGGTQSAPYLRPTCFFGSVPTQDLPTQCARDHARRHCADGLGPGTDGALSIAYARNLCRRPGTRRACYLRSSQASSEEVTSNGHAV